MRHDAKLGLALGMLVIGFAVAFCFPRQPVTSAWQKPAVPDPIAVENLDFLPIRAYRPTGDELTVASSPTVQPEIAERKSDRTLSVPPPPAPDPIAPLVEDSAPSAESAQPDPTVLTSQGPATDREDPAEHSSEKTYQVKPGDTLSGIASRCLGSSARYLEIYEANRDVLSSPDDLRIGIGLRLPPLEKERIPAVNLAASPGKSREKQRPEEKPPKNHSPGRGGIYTPPQAPWLAERPLERR